MTNLFIVNRKGTAVISNTAGCKQNLFKLHKKTIDMH